MSSDITVHSSSYQVDNRAWLIGTHGVDITPGITLDISKFNPANVNEVQTVTISATGGTFTLTCSGQTTTAIAWNAAATAVQSALEALSNIAVGDVSVAGANGGPYTVTFGGALGNQNVAALTGSGASLTGGAGTVTIATTTAGVTGHYVNGYIPSGFPLGKITATGLYGPYDDTANDGRQTCKGLLFSFLRAVNPTTGQALAKIGGALFVHGLVNEAKLPFAVDANGKADLSQIIWL